MGDSEELIRKWCVHGISLALIEFMYRKFKRTGKRDKVFLATKFGDERSKPNYADDTPENVRACLKRSLERLGVETIDLYYLHRLAVAHYGAKAYKLLTHLLCHIGQTLLCQSRYADNLNLSRYPLSEFTHRKLLELWRSS